jgi:IclR family transcriptional regulator, acetate operon repressor
MENAGNVRAVVRALRLLECLAAARRSKLTALAQEMGLSVSTCHRLLTTLQAQGFVRFEKKSACWEVGHRALAVGANFANARDLVALAHPFMLRAAGETRAIVNLGATAGADCIFLHRVDPAIQAGASVAGVGAIPAHCSSIGKAILASFHESEVRELIRGEGLSSRTEKSITNRRQLLADLRTSERRGFALDDQENTVGLRCVAAPIYNEFRRPVAAISLAAPASSLSDDQIPVFGQVVAAAAREITVAYGGAPPAIHGPIG